jgi:hypothetical protein
LAEIASLRGRQLGTVVSAVVDLVEGGEVEFDDGWVDQNRRPIIEAACARLGTARLSALKAVLPPEVTYEEIRLVVAHLRCAEAMSKESENPKKPRNS